MKERPILFSSPMIRALLDGRKTMTRRVVKPQPPDKPTSILGEKWGLINGNFFYCGIKCPYGSPGDRLWVRETWQDPIGVGLPIYRADGATAYQGMKWRPSIFMPRWASRITLEITGVRVERLQEIGRDDAKKEGFWPSDQNGLEHWNGKSYGNAELAFQACWQDINGKTYLWESNPWVWVIEFRKVSQ